MIIFKNQSLLPTVKMKELSLSVFKLVEELHRGTLFGALERVFDSVGPLDMIPKRKILEKNLKLLLATRILPVVLCFYPESVWCTSQEKAVG